MKTLIAVINCSLLLTGFAWASSLQEQNKALAKRAFQELLSEGRFELAEQGTLFLDEIANLPTSQQPKLLRVLETGEFERVGTSKTRKTDARIISATNADINIEVDEGRFRRDLLFAPALI